MSSYMKQWMEYENYACDKYYVVVFEREGTFVQKSITGILLSLGGGGVTLLSDDGMWFVKMKDVVFMKPAKPKIETLSPEYRQILSKIGYEDNYV